jgi:anti-sigma B factor antagonist
MCDNRAVQMPEEDAAKNLTLNVDRSGDYAVVRCRGRLVAGVNSSLHTEVSQLIPQVKRVVLDLTELTHMDSMGLATIVRLYVSAKSRGCELQLVNLGPRIQKLLGVTHLLPILSKIGGTGVPYM